MSHSNRNKTKNSWLVRWLIGLAWQVLGWQVLARRVLGWDGSCLTGSWLGRVFLFRAVPLWRQFSGRLNCIHFLIGKTSVKKNVVVFRVKFRFLFPIKIMWRPRLRVHVSFFFPPPRLGVRQPSMYHGQQRLRLSNVPKCRSPDLIRSHAYWMIASARLWKSVGSGLKQNHDSKTSVATLDEGSSNWKR